MTSVTGITWPAIAGDDIKAGEPVMVHVDRNSGATTVRKVLLKDIPGRSPYMDWNTMEDEANANEQRR